MSDTTPIIELKDVEVTFTSRTGSLFKPNKVYAVRGVNMRIERGQTLGIVGESGCGKSTTANVMCGLQMPTKGQVFFNGEEVTKRGADARRRIGRVVSVVFQDPATALNPRMHVADQLADPLRVHGIGDEASRAKRVKELISLVGLPSSALDGAPRTALGRPAPARLRRDGARPGNGYVLLDEPLNNLDIARSVEMMTMLERAAREFSRTIVIVLHDINFAARYASQICALKDGTVAFMGTPEEIMRDEVLTDIFDTPVTVVPGPNGPIACYF